MKVAALLEERRENWRRLESMCVRLETQRRSKFKAAEAAQFGALYRAVCADLALSDAYHLPPNTVNFLHQLVGRAHNQLYQGRIFQMSTWLHEMLYELPQRMYRDNCLRVAFFLFWGMFLAAMVLAFVSTEFAERAVGAEHLRQLEAMYSEPISSRGSGGASSFLNERSGMAGFYVFNNAGIGLRTFALGLLFGLGGLIVTVTNALVLGISFGHMAAIPERDNFFEFVTAHGPFELTALVLAAAAGMRLGFALVDTRGLSRQASVQRAAGEAMPMLSCSVILFVLAALIEAFVSPSVAPYWVKASVAALSVGLLLFYFVLLGNPRGASHAA